MSPLAQEELFTTDDIYALPEGTRAELIDGRIYYMAPPTRRHQKISGVLYSTIFQCIQSHKGSCEVYAAPFAVFLKKDGLNYVEPDISVICDPGKLNEKGCCGAPDWIIEIVSPGSIQMDYMVKLFRYHYAGVREYWIVDPLKSRIFAYYFEGEEEGSVHEYSFTDTVKAHIYDDLEIDFSEIG